MLNCKEASHLLASAKDKKHSLTTRTALKLHLMLCVYCRRFQKRMQFIHQALETKAGSESSVCLNKKAKAKIRSRLEKEFQSKS